MAGKKGRSQARKRSGKPVQDKDQRRKRPESPFCSDRGLQSLRKGLRVVYTRKGCDDQTADALFDRLAASLRLLANLHPFARKALSGDVQASREFHRRLSDLSGRRGIQGGAGTLLGRAGLGSGSFGTHAYFSAPMSTIAAFGRPCGGILSGYGMAEIYGAVYATYVFNLGGLTQPVSNDLPGALDSVAGLSLEHGHLEVLHNSLRNGGLEGLADAVEWGEASGNPYFGPPSTPFDGRGGLVGYTPDPGNPDATPGGRTLPFLDDCEWAREGCEGLLIEIFNRGAPSMPPPARSTWAHNIDQIEHTGLCEGNAMVIHGHDFGDTQPSNVQLVMRVNGVCTEILVRREDWSDTRILVKLPAGVSAGAVGFFNPDDDLPVQQYNTWVGRVNGDLRNINMASRCLGTPFEFPLLPRRTGTSKCAPETAVNVVDAGVPLIRFFNVTIGDGPVNVVVAEPNDELVLNWQIDNEDSVQLERVGGAGPDFGGSDVLVDPPGTSYDLGPAGHTQPQTFTYRLTATNGCGSTTAEVEVYASKRPGLGIEAIEVTQSVQTLDHQVTLIEHKPTVVRVYASHNLNGFGDDTVPGVTGRLRVHQQSGSISAWFSPINGAATQAPDPPSPNPNAFITLPASVDRTLTNDTLNFLIPAGLSEGTIRIEVEIRVDDFGAPQGASGLDERVSSTFESFSFVARRPLKIRYIPARVDLNVNNVAISVLPNFSNPPTDQECQDFLRETFKYFPSTPDSIERLDDDEVTLAAGRVVIRSRLGTFPIDLSALPISTESVWFDLDANATLEWYGLVKACDLAGIGGFVCPDNDDEIWVILAPITGVWGRAHWAAAVCITPMRLVSAAHEMAHTLNQHHIVSPGCGDGDGAIAFDSTSDPATWEDSSQILPDKVVPFDVIQNIAVTGDSNGLWDLMTYCGRKWTHQQRWDMLFNEIGS